MDLFLQKPNWDRGLIITAAKDVSTMPFRKLLKMKDDDWREGEFQDQINKLSASLK